MRLRDVLAKLKPAADTELDQHLLMLRSAVGGKSGDDPHMHEALVKCIREARRIRDDHAEVASLRGHPGWQRVATLVRARVGAMIHAEHSLALTDPRTCQLNAKAINEDLYLLNLVGQSGDQHDRAAEIAAMKKSQLLRHITNTTEDEDEE